MLPTHLLNPAAGAQARPKTPPKCWGADTGIDGDVGNTLDNLFLGQVQVSSAQAWVLHQVKGFHGSNASKGPAGPASALVPDGCDLSSSDPVHSGRVGLLQLPSPGSSIGSLITCVLEGIRPHLSSEQDIAKLGKGHGGVLVAPGPKGYQYRCGTAGCERDRGLKGQGGVSGVQAALRSERCERGPGHFSEIRGQRLVSKRDLACCNCLFAIFARCAFPKMSVRLPSASPLSSPFPALLLPALCSPVSKARVGVGLEDFNEVSLEVLNCGCPL